MWTRFILGLLPVRYRGLIEVGQRMFQRLDTQAERDAAIAAFLRMFDDDGKVDIIEWSQWGKQVGIFRAEPVRVPKPVRRSRARRPKAPGPNT